MININTKADIIIPFSTLGEEGWQANTTLILQALADNWTQDLAKPISAESIAALEARLGTTLPDSLALFYRTFGIANIGEELQDFSHMGWIKDIWEDSPYGPVFTDEDQKYLPFLISFSDYLGNGNMFCFHSETKEIYYYDHDTRPYLTKLFGDAGDYLKGCLINCQSDLYGPETDQEQVEAWCEEILDELYGSAVVEKWRY